VRLIIEWEFSFHELVRLLESLPINQIYVAFFFGCKLIEITFDDFSHQNSFDAQLLLVSIWNHATY
jgi:hypothetical protein